MIRLALILMVLPISAFAEGMADAPGGVVRWLDKMTGQTGDMALARGQTGTQGRLTVLLDACRYPADDPASDAEAHLTVTDATMPDAVFNGWMVASSPALSAMDHPRYDVWVLRCDTPEAAAAAEPATEGAVGE